MVKSKIYIEGGGESKDLHIKCWRGFRKLFEKCGFEGRMPQLVACGGRDSTFKDFQTACRNAEADAYVAMLVDSEFPLEDIERPWIHLNQRDGWKKPPGADNEQALMMTTCMETWIVADRESLRNFYGNKLNEKRLPDTFNLEDRDRHAVQDALAQATKDCKNGYRKGKRSFQVLEKLQPSLLEEYLPSFKRCKTILTTRLKSAG